jgi:hypothetical protein
VPRIHMFIDNPELYDAIYHFKDYARECDRLRSLIDEVVRGARTILDVACCTGVKSARVSRLPRCSRSSDGDQCCKRTFEIQQYDRRGCIQDGSRRPYLKPEYCDL